jgi:endonuclease G
MFPIVTHIRRYTVYRTCVTLLVALCACVVLAQPEPRPDPLDPHHEHDRWETQPRDVVREYRAYITSFDGPDDNDGDGRSDLWGIPEWVSYEIDSEPDHGPFEDRPHPWLTDRGLYEEGIAPRDQSYASSGFDRGHMCMREIARRLGRNADWNSHNLLNAVPQPHAFNAGLWLSLEKWTGIWANTYSKVWVICGPIVVNRAGNHKPSEWIGDGDEKRVAVPQKLFKIVVKESNNAHRPDVLAFVYPNDASLDDSSLEADHEPFLVAVRDIERLTGLNFFSALSRTDQDAIETRPATHLWPGPENIHPHNMAAARAPSAKESANMRMVAEIDRLYGQDVEDEREPKRELVTGCEKTIVSKTPRINCQICRVKCCNDASGRHIFHIRYRCGVGFRACPAQR